jgi:hypothetical protein
VIGAKTELAVLNGARLCGREKIRLHYPMFLMPDFGPRVGKEKEQLGEGCPWRQCIQEQASLRPDEEKILQLRAISLPKRPIDSFADHIDANTEFGGMGLCVRG